MVFQVQHLFIIKSLENAKYSIKKGPLMYNLILRNDFLIIKNVERSSDVVPKKGADRHVI